MISKFVYRVSMTPGKSPLPVLQNRKLALEFAQKYKGSRTSNVSEKEQSYGILASQSQVLPQTWDLQN